MIGPIKGQFGTNACEALRLVLISNGQSRLHAHREQDEGNAAPERSTELSGLAKEQHGQRDGVERLQVVAQVDGESGDGAQGLQLEQEGGDGENGGEDDEGYQVVAWRHHDGLWLTGRVDQRGHGEQHAAARELIEQHRAAGAACGGLHALAEHGEEGIEQRREAAHGDTQSVAGVETKDEQDATDGDKAEQQLAPRRTVTVDDGLDDGGEEADQREAHGANRDVGHLDAAIVAHPVGRQQESAAHHQRHLPPGQPVQTVLQGHDKGKENG